MIIPIRCFTCGAVISDRWDAYVRRQKEQEERSRDSKDDDRGEDAGAMRSDRLPVGHILDQLAVKRLCCRRHFLGNVDIMDDV